MFGNKKARSLRSAPFLIWLLISCQGPSRPARTTRPTGPRWLGGQYPGQQDGSDSAALQAALVGDHGARHARGQHVGGGNRQAEDVGHADQAGGGDLRRHALGVGHALLADFLANGQYHAFPADHGAQAQGQCNRQDHPERSVFGGGGQVLAQFVQVSLFTGASVGSLLTFFAVSSRQSR